MNIQLNVTFVIQIIHFIIAYMIVRFLVLKPAMILIDAQDKKREQMRDRISYNYLLIDREKSTIHDQWVQGRATFQQEEKHLILRPDLVFFKDTYPTQHRIQVPPETAQLLIKGACQELIARVKTIV